MRNSVLLIGCGRMGTAFVRGWQAVTDPAGRFDIYVLDPMGTTLQGVTHLNSPEDIAKLPAQLDILLAVKPISLPALLPQLRAHVGPDRLFVSIVAGAGIDYLRAELGDSARVIRAMPNTAVAVNAGISVALPGPMIGREQQIHCEMLLGCVGELLWLHDETQLDVATAISGSGPAYFFQFAEHLSRAAVQQGLDSDTALHLARATLIGAGALADNSAERLATLRECVTSPGGTTAAALNRLNAQDRLAQIVADAVADAAARSRELGQMK